MEEQLIHYLWTIAMPQKKPQKNPEGNEDYYVIYHQGSHGIPEGLRLLGSNITLRLR